MKDNELRNLLLKMLPSDMKLRVLQRIHDFKYLAGPEGQREGAPVANHGPHRQVRTHTPDRDRRHLRGDYKEFLERTE